MIDELISDELKRAALLHGEKFNSLIEGWAVTLEELQELHDEVELFGTYLDELWFVNIRKNYKITDEILNKLENTSINILIEGVQLAAMVRKLRNI